MKQFNLIFILSFFLQNLFGQTLTKAEAYAFADELLKIEMLSERGRNMLKMKIDLNKDGYQPMDGVTGASIKKGISKGYILDFLQLAFRNEMGFRMGKEEYNDIAKKYLENHDRKILTEEDHEIINNIFAEKLPNLEGWKIEETILSEDEIINNFGYSWGLVLGRETERRLIHKSRSVMGKTRSRTARELFEIGLFDEKMYDEIEEKMKLKELISELSIVEFAKLKIQYYEYLPVLKKEELTILNNLKGVGLLSENNFQELIHPKNAERELSRFEIFSKCKDAIVIKNEICETNPVACFQKRLDEVKDFIPDLNYKNFEYRIEEEAEDWNEDYFSLGSIIQLELDNKMYRSSYVQGFVNKKEELNWNLDSLKINYRESIIRLANKILVNRNSPKRLYSILEDVYGKEGEIAIMLMTEEQFKAWEDPYGMHFYPEDHNNFYTIQKLNEIIDDYKLIGLFDHLTKEEIEEGRLRVQEEMITSYFEILVQFPNLVVHFDWESFNLMNPYEELVTKFAKASKGNFKPENIKDTFQKDFEKSNTIFSFEVLGKGYTLDLRMRGDWLDERFLLMIDDAIKDNQVDGEFYDCMDDPQYNGYFFLTKRQYDFLKKEQPEIFYKNNSYD